MMLLILELPFPPTVNQYYRNVNGRTLISKQGRDYRQEVMRLIGKVEEPIKERVSVRIFAYMPDNRRRDIDNLNKSLLDAITHSGVWLDDSQIDDLHITREPAIIKGGTIKIVINKI
jgi:crossover junction endodeoxyribonuclease RusA